MRFPEATPRVLQVMGRVLTILRWLPLLAAAASAQDLITLEQAASRSGHDLAARLENRNVTIRGEVTAPPVWALGAYYLPLRDQTDHRLLLRADRDQFADL